MDNKINLTPKNVIFNRAGRVNRCRSVCPRILDAVQGRPLGSLTNTKEKNVFKRLFFAWNSRKMVYSFYIGGGGGGSPKIY